MEVAVVAVATVATEATMAAAATAVAVAATMMVVAGPEVLEMIIKVTQTHHVVLLLKAAGNCYHD